MTDIKVPPPHLRCERMVTPGKQCILTKKHTGECQARPVEGGPMAGRIATFPRCLGCGVTVDESDKQISGGRVCVVCADKPQYQAPKGMLETGAQPTPAYQRDDYLGAHRREKPEAQG